ncbi:MAG TPA: DUF3784 domain-containing protein [Anditalea sp.]|nr:DUF3784 domain-containing protein [Anditalea sp.]
MESIYIGLLYIILGILIKFFPSLLAGYGSLSQKDKENAKNNGVSTFAMIVFCIMGLILLTGHFFIAPWVEEPSFISNLNIAVTLVGTVVMIVGGNIMINVRRTD